MSNAFTMSNNDMSKMIAMSNTNYNILLGIVNEVIGNGGPSGVFDTLQELNDRYPKGAKGVYLITINGKWYYWDGSEWIAGGVYQATQLSDGSVTEVKLEIGLQEKIQLIPELLETVNDFNERLTFVIAHNGDGKKDTELIDARGGAPVLGYRLNAIDAQLADITYDVKTFGALGDGVTDDTDAIDLAFLSVPDGQSLKFPKGHYVYNGKISKQLAKGLHLQGDAGTIIDMRNNPHTATTDSLIYLYGQRDYYESLLSNVSRGSYTIDCGVNVSKGDYILLSSSDKWNELGPEYIKGEICQVAGVSGTTITLVSALLDSYTIHPEDTISSFTRVHKLTMPTISISNLTLLCDANVRALQIDFSRDLMITNTRISGARQMAIVTNYIYKATVDSCSVDDCWFFGTEQSYGINFNSSQHITISNTRIFGGRHAIAFGGVEPTRDINVITCTLDSHKDSGANCLDFHATDGLTVIGCEILNGIVLQGATNFNISHNTIKRTAAANYAIHAYITKSMDFAIINGNNIETLQGNSIGIAINFRHSNYNLKLVDLTSNYCKSANAAIYIFPDATTTLNNSIDLMVLNDNYVIAEQVCLRIDEYPSTPATRINIKEMQIKGGYYLSNQSLNPLLIKGNSNDRLVMQNTKVESKVSDSAVMNIDGIDKVLIDSCYLTNTGTSAGRNMVLSCNYLTITNTTLNNFRRSGGIDTTVSNVITLNNNLFISCLGSLNHLGTAIVVSDITMSGNRISYGTAPPTSGSWIRGDVRFNIAPTLGGPAGWECTSAGTPGTWHPFGLIGATKMSAQSDSVANDITALRTDFNNLLSKLRVSGFLS